MSEEKSLGGIMKGHQERGGEEVCEKPDGFAYSCPGSLKLPLSVMYVYQMCLENKQVTLQQQGLLDAATNQNITLGTTVHHTPHAPLHTIPTVRLALKPQPHTSPLHTTIENTHTRLLSFLAASTLPDGYCLGNS